MGEARIRDRRNSRQKSRKKGQSIVISCPMIIDHECMTVKSNLDPVELRRSVLFFDHLLWPKNNLYYANGSKAEVAFLEAEGLLSRPMMEAYVGEIAEVTAALHVQCFHDADRREPGRWCLSQGETSFLLRTGAFEEGRGTLLELYRAIPIPEGNVPLEEILRFKLRRKDEIDDLKSELGRLYTSIKNAKEDRQFELMRTIDEVDSRCANIMRVAAEEKFSFRLSNFEFEYPRSISDIKEIVVNAAAGATFASSWGMPKVGALVGGAASLIRLKKGNAYRYASAADQPYRLLSSMERDFVGMKPA